MTDATITVRCDLCAFYRPVGADTQVGTPAGACHRFPPPNLWPRVLGSDWCGEFKRAQETRSAQPMDLA